MDRIGRFSEIIPLRKIDVHLFYFSATFLEWTNSATVLISIFFAKLTMDRVIVWAFFVTVNTFDHRAVNFDIVYF